MEYKIIPGWPKYKVSRDGCVIGQRNKKLKPATCSWGYKTVVLCNNNFRKTVKVHRLVAMAYIPNPEDKPTVNHKNGVKTDNRVENLEWATVKEQQIHRARTLGFGVEKANESLKKPIKCLETGEIFNSIKEAAKAKNGDRGSLSEAARNGNSWHDLHWVLISRKGETWH